MSRRKNWQDGPWGFGPPAGPPGFGRGFGSDDEGHGRRRRLFDNGDLKLLILALLEDAPRHGYDLMRVLEERSRGAYAPSPGVVYPTLSMLEELQLIEPAEGRESRKAFALTEAGRAHLRANQELVTNLLAKLDSFAAMRERTDSAPIRRAMANLKTALIQKISSSPSSETAFAIAALIDEVAQKIERL